MYSYVYYYHDNLYYYMSYNKYIYTYIFIYMDRYIKCSWLLYQEQFLERADKKKI